MIFLLRKCRFFINKEVKVKPHASNDYSVSDNDCSGIPKILTRHSLLVLQHICLACTTSILQNTSVNRKYNSSLRRPHEKVKNKITEICPLNYSHKVHTIIYHVTHDTV